MKRMIWERKGVSMLAAGALLLSILACVSDPGFEEGSDVGIGDDVGSGAGEGGAVEVERCSSPQEFSQTVIDDAVTIDGCYVVDSTIKVVESGRLTIAPGSQLYFHFGAGIDVEGGILTAAGRREAPILFAGKEDNPPISGREADAVSAWSGIHFKDTKSDDNRLEYVISDGGGYNVISNSHLTFLTASATVKNSTFKNSSNIGLKTFYDSELREFSNNEFIGGYGPYMAVDFSSSKNLHGDNTFSGSSREVIELFAYHDTADPVAGGRYVIPNLGIPYEAPFGIHVVGQAVRVEINAGVVLRIGEHENFTVYDRATLVAAGTPEEPVLIEADGEYWDGMRIYKTGSPANELKNVIIREALGESNRAALDIGWSSGPNADVTTRIKIENLKIERSQELVDRYSWISGKLFVGPKVRFGRCIGLEIDSEDIIGDGKEDALEACGFNE